MCFKLDTFSTALELGGFNHSAMLSYVRKKAYIVRLMPKYDLKHYCVSLFHHKVSVSSRKVINSISQISSASLKKKLNKGATFTLILGLFFFKKFIFVLCCLTSPNHLINDAEQER